MSRGDLSDAEWRHLKDLLPAERGRKSRPAFDNRMVVDGILWRIRTGAPWRDLPEKYGKWMTVYQRFRRWSEAGVWEAVASTLARRWPTIRAMRWIPRRSALMSRPPAQKGDSRTSSSFDPRAAFIFDGVGQDERIGDFGILAGGASGSEIDAVDPLLGTPPHTLVVASSVGHSANTYLVPDETGFHHSAMDCAQNPRIRADMTFFETPAGGAVFSVGSIAWGASLPHNGYDNNVSRISENVLRRFLEPELFPMPRGANSNPPPQGGNVPCRPLPASRSTENQPERRPASIPRTGLITCCYDYTKKNTMAADAGWSEPISAVHSLIVGKIRDESQFQSPSRPRRAEMARCRRSFQVNSLRRRTGKSFEGIWEARCDFREPMAEAVSIST